MGEIGNFGNLNFGNYRFGVCGRDLDHKKYHISFFDNFTDGGQEY
jgi:hypothetical protein